MSKVEVLCPNGRRVYVLVTPNTKILQILEEACTKQGFLPASNFQLKHGRRALDVTLSVQFAALPNNAKLELEQLSKSRVESSVIIALQLSNGARLQAEFQPSTTLWEVLEHFDSRSESDSTLRHSSEPTVHPVCIYMNDEIAGEYALREKNLRSLGLTGGRAIIRHMFRELTDEVLASIMHNIDTEKARQSKLQQSRPVNVQDDSRLPEKTSPASEQQPVEASGSNAVERYQEPMNTEGASDVGFACRGITDGWNVDDQWSSVFREPAYQQPPARQSNDDVVSMSTHAPVQSPFADFKFPESTKGQNLYQNELSDSSKDDLQPCARETVVYSLDEPLPEFLQMDEEVPDEFFEVTESDIRKMWQDLQRKSREMSEQPLLTQSSRQQQLEAKMSRYKRVVIRIQFPDRLVIQGLFRLNETVFALYKFVKEHLSNRSMEFELYTTPPKLVLKNMYQTLVEANLAPMSLVYFSSQSKQDHYLSDATLCEISTQQAANLVLVTLVPQSTSSSNLSQELTSASGSSNRPVANQPSTSASSSHGGGAVPKWFRTGNK